MLKRFSFSLALMLVALVGTTANAQELVLSIVDCPDPAPVGGSFTNRVLFDNTGASDVQGWSWGVCQMNAAVTAVADGSTTQTVNMGGPPDFNQINILPDGWTVGVVISFTGMDVLPPGSGYELNLADYDVTGAPGDTYDICFCNTLGDPPVATVIVIGGQSNTPDQNCCAGGIAAGPPPFIFTAPDDNISYDGTTGDAGQFDISVGISEDVSAPGLETQGFSMDLMHTISDGAMSADDLVPAPLLADLNGGAGPDFFGPTLLPEGWTAGVVYSFTGMATIFFTTTPQDVLTATYSASGLPTGMGGTANADLEWVNTLGSPPVVNVVVVAGQSEDVAFNDGRLDFAAVTDTPFIRGNCNPDTIVNIADGIWILNFLFQGGPAGTCAEACDANGDGMLDSSDATFIFEYRFLDGPPPPAPFPDCGTVPGADCDDSNCP